MAVPLNRHFDYLPPPGDHQPSPGVRVKVPFGARTLFGVVVEVRSQAQVATDKLKRAYEILDVQPVLSVHQLSMVRWAAAYYACPIGEAVMHALPPALRKGALAQFEQKKHWQLTAVGHCLDSKVFKRSPKQANAWSLLKEHTRGLDQKTLTGLGVPSSSLAALNKKGWAESVIRETLPQPPSQHQTSLKTDALVLNSEQNQVLAKILSHSSFHVHLVRGVTGSGKTEVYLQLIEQTLKAGKQALVLIPEIGLTPQTLARFKNRFHCPVLSFHSQLTEKQRLEHWLTTQQAQPLIGIGTRSSIWAPFTHLGIIIIDEEHDASFKQQDGFLYNARDLGVYRAKLLDIPIVLGSATPSLESWYNAEQGRYTLYHLNQRAGCAQPPKTYLENLGACPTKYGMSQGLLKKISARLSQGEQCLIFLNRRGYAPTLYCNDCGWIAQCTHCDARMTFHKAKKLLRCHHCDYQAEVPSACAECGSEDLNTQGRGTEKLEDQLTQYFKPHPVVRIDRDTTRNKDALVNQLQPITSGKPCVLIGTQMISKGHHFEGVTLVVVVNIDGGLFSCDFRASERMLQLLTQVAGRCGRGSIPGEVWVQTYHPKHPLLTKWVSEDYPALASYLLRERMHAGLPPSRHMVLIQAEAHHKNMSVGFLKQVIGLLNHSVNAQLLASVTVLGPAPAPMARKQGRIRMQLLLQAEQRKPLHLILSNLLQSIPSLDLHRRVRWIIDVDPQDLC